MKITEPKTPYAKQYDPAEDEEEMSLLDPDQLKVDEADEKRATKLKREDDIPGLDIGEPELEAGNPQTPDSEKRVLVDENMIDDEGRHGEVPDNATAEELEKHKKFEEMRKKHYEMKNVKDLLA